MLILRACNIRQPRPLREVPLQGKLESITPYILQQYG